MVHNLKKGFSVPNKCFKKKVSTFGKLSTHC